MTALWTLRSGLLMTELLKVLVIADFVGIHTLICVAYWNIWKLERRLSLLEEDTRVSSEEKTRQKKLLFTEFLQKALSVRHFTLLDAHLSKDGKRWQVNVRHRSESLRDPMNVFAIPVPALYQNTAYSSVIAEDVAQAVAIAYQPHRREVT